MHSLSPVRKPNHGHIAWRDEHHCETQSAELKLISNQNPLGQALTKSQSQVMTTCCHYKTSTLCINHASCEESIRHFRVCKYS